MNRYQDRRQSGQVLARKLMKYAPLNPLVIALPLGGISVAYEISNELEAPLDFLPVRKLGAPGRGGLALGAIAEGAFLNEILTHEFRSEIPEIDVTHRTVILVDDGLATGATMCAAAQALRAKKAARVIAAIAVASEEGVVRLTPFVDELICPIISSKLSSVGSWFDDFSDVNTEEGLNLLKKARAQPLSEIHHRELLLHLDGLQIPADLNLPDLCRGLVVFAHGSGSSRRSPRNRFVAASFNRAHFATLLFDLLTPEEAHNKSQVFNIPLLASRLQKAANEMRSILSDVPVALFGTSTGAAAILKAASVRNSPYFALISRGGRPDLALEDLPLIQTPTLLLVGANDTMILELNQLACEKLPNAEMQLIPGASHVFEEPGTLEQVVEHSIDWLIESLPFETPKWGERLSMTSLPSFYTPL